MMNRSPSQITIKNKNLCRAFTLTETIVATMIFVMAAAGMLAVIASMTKPAATSVRELTAVLVGKGILDDLRKDVDAETWGSVGSRLAAGSGPVVADQTLEGVAYNITYNVTADVNGGRNVSMTVTWDE